MIKIYRKQIEKSNSSTMSNNSTMPNRLESIADVYDSNPVVRALIQVVTSSIPFGIGSAIDDALTSTIDNMRHKRMRTFFDELSTNPSLLTEKIIQQEDFLHAYFSTLRAAMNSRTQEKVRLFARLLSNSAGKEVIQDDTYEEFLGILDNVSVRELRLMMILHRFEQSNPHELIQTGTEASLENDLQRATRFWQDFESAAHRHLKIEPEILSAVLTRLTRTGLYETFAGSFLDYSGGKGKLSPLFDEFVQWIDFSTIELELE